ncbi:MAG: ISL3 family transposase [Planctomycetota bacterium]
MRATTLLRTVFAIYNLFVAGFCFQEDGIVVDVRPLWQVPRCSTCGIKCRRVHEQRERRWRHHDICGWKTFLRYSIRRVKCSRCRKVTTEAVPWAVLDSGFTRAFEERCAFYAQHANRSVVSESLRVAWTTVGRIVDRVVKRSLGPLESRLDGLRHIGIDELSYRKHHEYITTVVDHVSGVVVWTGKGKRAARLREFFKALGPERAAKLQSVTIDMSGAFIAAVEECAPNARLIFDRFHVQRLVQDALDETRRDEMRAAETKDERAALKGTRFPLQKSPWNLTDADHQTLDELRETNAPLYTAYLLKEIFAGILDRRQVNVAEGLIVKWIANARESGLRHFVRAAKTIEGHLDGVLEYVRTRLTNAMTEGLNGKIRTITRRAYGFHSAHSLMAMIHLCCGGVHVTPAFSRPPRRP